MSLAPFLSTDAKEFYQRCRFSCRYEYESQTPTRIMEKFLPRLPVHAQLIDDLCRLHRLFRHQEQGQGNCQSRNLAAQPGESQRRH